MHIFTQSLFQGVSISIPENPVNATNLKCIAALESKDRIVLVAHPKITGIEHPLSIHKDKQTMTFDDDVADLAYTKKLYFSLFIGFISFKETLHLVLADKIKSLKFGHFDVFEISSVTVYAVNTLTPNLDLSQILTEYYKLGFLFSYEIDLTDSINYLSAFDVAKDPFKYRKNFIYFANRNMVTTCITPTNKEWAMPVIYGRLQHDTIYKEEASIIEVYFLYKASVLDINPRYREDMELLEDFYCPTSFHAIDTFVTQDNTTTSFGVVFNDFPGVTRTIKLRSKGDYFTSHISPRKIAKYFEFMKYYTHSTAFIFSGKKESVDLMSTVNEYLKVNSGFRSIVKHMVALKTEDYSELLQACNTVSDKLSGIDFLSDDRTSEFNGTFVSFCTERPIEDMEECFNRIYINYLKQDVSSRNISTQARSRISFDDLNSSALFLSTTQLQRQIIKGIFHVISVSKRHISDIHEYLKASLKELNVKASLSKVMNSIYGPHNSISRSYMRILDRYELPVFNTREMKIGIITHNCGGAVASKKLMESIYYHQMDSIRQCDLLVIGLQEIIEMKSKNWGKIIKNDNMESLHPWVESLTACFSEFDVVSNVSMLGLLLIVFIKKSVAQVFDVSVHELEQIKMGLMNLANKGGIFLRFKINYEQIGLFNCHLAAGTKIKSYQKRQENLVSLASYLDDQSGLTMSFILGDMNFRTTLGCDEAEHLINKYVQVGSYEETTPYLQKLLAADELTEYMKYSKGSVLGMFSEAPITFLPSYKWVIGKNAYNYDGGKRAPSW